MNRHNLPFKDQSILLLAIAQTLVWAGFYYLFPALLLRWEQSLGWSKTDLTVAITLAIFVSAMTAPLAGRLIDAGKGALMMTVSSFFGGLCLIWLSLVSSLFEFYFIWALIGVVMAGCLFEPCFALITRAKGEKAKQSIILVTLMVGFASTLCYPGIYTLSETYGWRSAVQFFAAVLISIATPLMWFGAQPFEQEGKANARLNNIHSLRNRYSGFWHWPLLCWQLSTVSSFITCFQFSPTGALMRIPQS
jgi:MFS family permease